MKPPFLVPNVDSEFEADFALAYQSCGFEVGVGGDPALNEISIFCLPTNGTTTGPYSVLETTLRKSEYSNTRLNFVELDPNADFRTIVAALRRELGNTVSPFVFCAVTNLYLPPRLLRFAVDFLSQTSGRHSLGIAVNPRAWTEDETGEVSEIQLSGSVFDRTEQLAGFLTSLSALRSLLSSIVFRREGLLDLLDATLRASDELSSEIPFTESVRQASASGALALLPHRLLGFVREPAPARLLKKGIDGLMDQRPADALTALERTCAIQDDLPGAHHARGVARARLGDLWGARIDAEAELSRYPQTYDALELVRQVDALIPRTDLAFDHIAGSVDQVEGFLVPGQERYLFEKVKALPDGAIILEIGSYLGRSTSALAFACVGTNKRVFCIDTYSWNTAFVTGSGNWRRVWEQHLAQFGLLDYVTCLHGPSNLKLAEWGKSASVDFAFIDAAHHYGFVLQDFCEVYPLMKTGGFIALHDSDPSWPGPWRVWREYGMSTLINHEYCSSISCGQVPDWRESATLPQKFEQTEWPYAVELAKHFRELYPTWAEFVGALEATLDSTLERSKAEERFMSHMPFDAGAIIQQMIERKEFEDPMIGYWGKLVSKTEERLIDLVRQHPDSARALGLVE